MKDDINIYKGFEFPNDKVRTSSWDIQNTGYDYSKTLISNSLSKYLYGNKSLAGFLDTLNGIMVHLVDCVKYIRNFYNYAVPKDYKKIN